MSKKIHFKAKKYGWGWYPATPTAWLILGIFILFFTVTISIAMAIDTVISIIIGSILCAIYTVGLIAFSYIYGEEPRWRWGGE